MNYFIVPVQDFGKGKRAFTLAFIAIFDDYSMAAATSISH